ncbi:MAG TPA: MaoC family dehydratase [Thermoanaerobaculia bacterium]
MSRPHATSRDLATLDDFVPGQSASFSKTIGEVELALFVALSGDVNPLHVDEEFARWTFFGGRIAHGLLSASLLSTVIGTLLPGTGAIYKSQSLRFLRPVHPGDTLTATVEVRDLDRAQGDLHLATRVANQRGEPVIEGEAVVGLLRRLRQDG